jgi:hypothetical protein
MNKKGIIKLMTSVVLVAALCLSTAAPVFAANTDNAVITSSAAINKKLEVPFGTNIPATLGYEFVIKSIEEDGQAPTTKMPVLGATKVDDTTGKSTITFGGTLTPVGTTGGITTYSLESEDLLAGVDWKHAGVYEYQITETRNAPYVPSASEPKEELTYSKAVYTMFVYVKDISGVLTVTHVGALKITDDEGGDIDADDQVKVDPTYGRSQMSFVNKYVKTNGKDDPRIPANRTLAISKTVIGDYADHNTYFPFSVTVNKPSLVLAAVTYKAYFVNTATGDIITPTTDNYTGTVNADKSIDFAPGTPNDIKLKDGETLAFVNTHVGATYTVTETGNPVYMASARVTTSGTQDAKEGGDEKGNTLVLPHTSNDIYTDTLYVGDKNAGGDATNKADFLNDSGSQAVTGISMDNMPFVVIIATALAGLVGYVALKSRKENSLEA